MAPNGEFLKIRKIATKDTKGRNDSPAARASSTGRATEDSDGIWSCKVYGFTFYGFISNKEHTDT